MANQDLRRHRLGRVLFWVVALLFVKVFLSIVWEYRRYFPADFESDFLSGRRYSFLGIYRNAFYIHIIASPISLILATFLMVTAGRLAPLHRWIGRLQFFLVLLIVVPSGMLMAREAYAGPIAGLGFASLNVAVAASLIVAVWQARAGKFASHRRWATRCFLLLASPLLLRVFSGLAIVTDTESEWMYRFNAWGSWLLPLLIYEICIRHAQRQQSRISKPPT